MIARKDTSVRVGSTPVGIRRPWPLARPDIQGSYYFRQGLPGFEQVKFFQVRGVESHPFFRLESVAPAGIAFLCIDPSVVMPGYSPLIAKAEADTLELLRSEDARLLCIACLDRHTSNATINLMGPIALNVRSCLGRQVTCTDAVYPVRFSLNQSLPARTGSGKAPDACIDDKILVGV